MEFNQSCIPPGFRFHPTEEELVGYYLNRKVNSLKIDLDVIIDIDLYRMEPWDIQGRCRLGYQEQTEWYFFSHKDRKYPTGTRTNRATSAGFWKATGRDKAVVSKERIIGMRKTLVFYKGRAPNGRKTDWIMHEYRLQTSEHAPPQEEGWVVCRAFKKPNPTHKPDFEAWNSCYYLRDGSIFGPEAPSYPSTPSVMPGVDQSPGLNLVAGFHNSHSFPDESLRPGVVGPFESQMIEFPKLDSPSMSTSFATNDTALNYGDVNNEEVEDEKSDFGNQLFSEWDTLFASQVIGSSSFDYMPLATHNEELDAQSHLSHVLECFPDL